jgi:hypothetical protein
MTLFELLTDDAIRYFFAKREWLRPSDYEQMVRKEPLKRQRRRDLSIFIAGYKAGRS